MSASAVIQSCLERGIREFVVCAGARNLPLVTALTQCEDVYVWNHFEERSAGFFALGRTMASQEPCGVVVTSGTAVAELLPAVIEAHYQARPLVIISADRPAEFRGSGAPQAIEQVDIFGSYVESCVDMNIDVVPDWKWSGKGPMHLNVCLPEEVEVEAREYTFTPFEVKKDPINVSDVVHFVRDVWTGLVVAVGGLEPEDREEVFHFLKDLKVPVIVDATSGLREALGNKVIANPEPLITGEVIGKVLRIGDIPVGRFWRDLEDHPNIEVLSITRTGFSGLARESKVVKGSVSRIIKGMGDVEEVGDVMSVFDHNSRDWAYGDELVEAYPDSEPGMMHVLSQYATMASSVYLGNSQPIREWNQFAQRSIPVEFVRANRGANGIDGQLSTWLGNTAGVEDSWCVVGDLTALYDMSALSWLKQCGGDNRVLVIINNGGGKIFDRLPRVQELDDKVKEIVANAHEWDFSHLAAMWGMEYACYSSADAIEIEASEQGLLVELRPSEKQTEQFWQQLDQRK